MLCIELLFIKFSMTIAHINKYVKSGYFDIKKVYGPVKSTQNGHKSSKFKAIF